MKRFISGGYYKSELELNSSSSKDNNNKRNNEDLGLEVSNFYKDSIKNSNGSTKLPERLSKRLKTTTRTTAAATAETIKSTAPIDNNNNSGSGSDNNNYCEFCETKFTNKIQHETSITHILSEKTKENFKPIRHSSSKLKDNVGYKLLLDKGWNDGEGLGIESQGTINPIENEKKLNKSGVGKQSEIKTLHQEKENNNILEFNNDPTLLIPSNYKNKKRNLKIINDLKKERESRIRELL